MAVLGPGFSERVFEFSFNAEYADRNRAVLAGAPSIPTQKEEKLLGYDVKFEIARRGGAIHAVALQHKVARYVDDVGPTNRHFRKSAGGPYYAFRLDTDQYNLIEAIASKGAAGLEFWYCAPLFSSRSAMNGNYMKRAVESNSVWIDVSGAGQISDDEVHTIVYTPNGSKAFRFSEKARPLKVVTAAQRHRQWKARRDAVLTDFTDIYSAAFGAVEAYWPRRRRAPAAEARGEFRLPAQLPARRDPTVQNTARLLSQYCGASLLVEVRQ